MKFFRVFLFSFIAVCFLFTGFYGCAKKQLKSEEGQLKAQQPQETAQAAPAESKEQPKPEMQKTVPPGPKEQPEPVETAIQEKSLSDIHFAFNMYDIQPSDGKILEDNARWIKANKPGLVVIEGNCDERGTVEYNLALGERRAEAARRYLVSLGIEDAKLKTISYGKNKPVDFGHNEEAWAKNRRDHFVVQ